MELGRQLAAQFGDDDILRRWMAHHLAELVSAAKDESTTTIEQRRDIVDLILRIWAHRRYVAGADPLDGYPAVFVALDRLGDDAPWRFLRLTDDLHTDTDEVSSSLLRSAIELAEGTRATVIELIFLAAVEAQDANSELLDIADKVLLTPESRVTRRLGTLRRGISGSRLMRERSHGSAIGETAFEDEDDERPPDAESIRSQVSSRLRVMAAALVKSADAIDAERPLSRADPHSNYAVSHDARSPEE